MDIGSLIEKIKTININYENELKQTGENFNIFNILGFSKDELSHSRILKELLDPKGSHNKGDTFLKLFLEETNISDFNIENTTTEIEKFIGFISEDYENGGRIDIVISKNHNQEIYIENKIDADDQEKQLLRYHNYNPKAIIIYLTTDGRDASEKSTGGKYFDYIRISYSYHIRHWLEKCMEKSENNPIVKETIKQYIVLLKQLTGQTRSEKMGKSIQEVITESKYNIEAALAIKKAVDSLKSSSLELFKNNIFSELQKTYLNAFYDKGEGWNFISIPIKTDKYYFDINYDWRSLSIHREESNNSNPKEEKALANKLEELTKKKNKDWNNQIWASDECSYPELSNIDSNSEFYFFYLYKEYSENPNRVVELILSWVKELDIV